jgi:hypothetical protein
MTVDTPAVALQVLAEDPRLLLFRYHHAVLGAERYVLLHAMDLDQTPMAAWVEEPTVLYAGGAWSTEGLLWRAGLAAESDKEDV